MSDIVDRLRQAEWYCGRSAECMGTCGERCARRNLPDPDEAHAAADEIIRLRNQLDAARTGKALLALEAERNLCDQLADHLRGLLADTHERRYTDDGGCGGCYDALAAYEAARKEAPQADPVWRTDGNDRYWCATCDQRMNSYAVALNRCPTCAARKEGA